MKQRLLQIYVGMASLLVLGALSSQQVLASGPCGTGQYDACPITLTEITDYIKYGMKFLYGIGGVIVAGFIIWGAIRLTTAGGDDGKVTEAKQIITNAIYGALVLFGVWVILATINVIVTRGFFN